MTRGARRITRLMRDRRGVAAIELAMLGLPLIMLLCAIMEASVAVLAQQSLDASLEKAARAVRTGEFQNQADSSDPVARMRQAMCGTGFHFFNCSALRLDLAASGSFTASRVADPYDTQQRNWSQSFGTRFECPAGGDVVTLRAAVTIARAFSFLDLSGRPMPDNQQLLVATSVFRAENYQAKLC